MKGLLWTVGVVLCLFVLMMISQFGLAACIGYVLQEHFGKLAIVFFVIMGVYEHTKEKQK